MLIGTGILSTTHIDRHYERMAKSALDGMADQIKEKFIPQFIDHNPNMHIGVVLYGEVFQLLDGEYALGIVFGTFKNEEEKTIFKTGKPNKVWEEYKKYLDVNELIKFSAENSKKIDRTILKRKLNIADWLEIHLDSTQIWPDGTVGKIKKFIAATGDLRIEVYPKDHNPQHFHVVSKQRHINARFDIKTLALISNKTGHIEIKDVKKIQNFFKTFPEHLKKLIDEHDRMI